MREDYMSRKDKHDEAIMQLLNDVSKTSTDLILYAGEIPYLERKYHIKITKGKPFKNENNLPLFICTAEKLY